MQVDNGGRPEVSEKSLIARIAFISRLKPTLNFPLALLCTTCWGARKGLAYQAKSKITAPAIAHQNLECGVRFEF